MARIIEYIKKSEARIMIFIEVCENSLKCGRKISEKLRVDYIYTMRILGAMYDKGWLLSHVYNCTTYFRLSEKAPIELAKEIYTNPQVKLKTENVNRKIQESNLEAQRNESKPNLQQ